MSRPCRPVTIVALASVAVGAALAVGGCAETGDGVASTEASPTASPSETATTAVERRDLVSYADTPSALWTFSAQDSGVAADGELTLVDPAVIVPTSEGSPPPEPIDAGDILVMAVTDGAATAIVGIGADSGTAEWTYAPAGRQLGNCARETLGFAIACAVTNPADSTYAVVLIDAQSGQVVRQIDLPDRPVGIAVGADRVVAMTDLTPQVPEGEAHSYAVTAVDAAGGQRWSTQVEYRPSLGRGPSLNLGVGGAWTAIELNGSVYVLATDDGELVLQRDVGITDERHGLNWSWAPAEDALLVHSDALGEAPQVVVLGADGSEDALTGYAVLSPVVAHAAATVLQDTDGQIATIDPRTGTVDATGVRSPTGEAQSASEVDGVLLVRGDSLVAYALADPGSPAWEQPFASAFPSGDALTDGSLLYLGGVAPDAAASDGALVYSALDLADGSLLWTQTVEPGSAADLPTVARGGGRLIVMNGSTMTAWG